MPTPVTAMPSPTSDAARAKKLAVTCTEVGAECGKLPFDQLKLSVDRMGPAGLDALEAQLGVSRTRERSANKFVTGSLVCAGVAVAGLIAGIFTGVNALLILPSAIIGLGCCFALVAASCASETAQRESKSLLDRLIR